MMKPKAQTPKFSYCSGLLHRLDSLLSPSLAAAIAEMKATMITSIAKSSIDISMKESVQELQHLKA